MPNNIIRFRFHSHDEKAAFAEWKYWTCAKNSLFTCSFLHFVFNDNSHNSSLLNTEIFVIVTKWFLRFSSLSLISFMNFFFGFLVAIIAKNFIFVEKVCENRYLSKHCCWLISCADNDSSSQPRSYNANNLETNLAAKMYQRLERN